jgi:hypothetical protein
LEGRKREGSAEHFGPGHEKREEKRERKRGGGSLLGFVKGERR